MNDFKLTTIADVDVDAALDLELRQLLATCFDENAGSLLLPRRYFDHCPAQRWLIRNHDDAVVAHAAVHPKEITYAAGRRPIAGIGDVCVRPDARRRGLCSSLLTAIHSWAQPRGYVFALLFGDPAIYLASGYALVHNVWVETSPGTANKNDAMVKSLGPAVWPESNVFLESSFF